MLLFDRERSSRIGVLRKDASSESSIRWFKLSAMYAYHVANAWQEGGSYGCPEKIRIFLCVYDDSVCSLHCNCSAPSARQQAWHLAQQVEYIPHNTPLFEQRSWAAGHVHNS